jgi:hypothetical protein
MAYWAVIALAWAGLYMLYSYVKRKKKREEEALRKIIFIEHYKRRK